MDNVYIRNSTKIFVVLMIHHIILKIGMEKYLDLYRKGDSSYLAKAIVRKHILIIHYEAVYYYLVYLV